MAERWFLVRIHQIMLCLSWGGYVKASRQTSRKCDGLWFLLSLPVVWLAWLVEKWRPKCTIPCWLFCHRSIILFIGTILIYVWGHISIQSSRLDSELQRRKDSAPRMINIFSALSVSSLLIIMVIQMLLIGRIFFRLEEETDVEVERSFLTQSAWRTLLWLWTRSRSVSHFLVGEIRRRTNTFMVEYIHNASSYDKNSKCRLNHSLLWEWEGIR